jgi:hypothetical protein
MSLRFGTAANQKSEFSFFKFFWRKKILAARPNSLSTDLQLKSWAIAAQR